MAFVRGIKCDRCGAADVYKESYRGLTKWQLKRWARDDGWSFGKRDLCPSCRKQTKNGRRR